MLLFAVVSWIGVAWQQRPVVVRRSWGPRGLIPVKASIGTKEGSAVFGAESSAAKAAAREAVVAREARAKDVWERIAVSSPTIFREPVVVSESAPEGLSGTWFVNGLGSCRIGDRLVHPFEAHGFIKAIRFERGVVSIQSRYVETAVQKLESWARRPLFRGAMSNVADFTFPGFVLNALSPSTRSVAQLAVRKWGDKLLAMTDNAPFYAMDTENLETVGVETLFGSLDERGMLAHTRVDHRRGTMVAAATEFKVFDDQTRVVFWEFDEAGREVSRVEHDAPFFVFHDWALTEDYYVVPFTNGIFDVSRIGNFALGRIPATDLFGFDPSATAKLLLIPRDGSREPTTADLGQFGSIFHVGPTWVSDGRLTAHVLMFDRYEFGGEMGFDVRRQTFDPIPWSEANGGPKLYRVDVDLETRQTALKKLSDIPTDMPTFFRDVDECRYVYGASGVRPEGWFPFNALSKFDLETQETTLWIPPDSAEDCVTSEPLFVPRADQEDDGWVLSLLHNVATNSTELLVFDAHDFGAGPIWSTKIAELWPWNVHTTFDPA
ncbi:hypothetical protein CTAYLR_006637 [Chrysophaeum taylorii]|uniref:Dioxygenase n=1 Tax=Chrysophaeum taylorii TaxID=2483200 RepID=A0AAD7UK90_9STRA|nr:hypothetical protein CTAYLR_006637 [Chrysophaeum taylorii]